MKGKESKGIIYKLDLTKGFECKINADWASSWNKDHANDPKCAYSCTGYIITCDGCPIVWECKIQSLVALFIAEAEVIALSTTHRGVIMMINLLKEFKSQNINIPSMHPKINCKNFEDNSVCIQLAKFPKLHSRTEHLSCCLFYSCQHILNSDISIEHINTKE